MTFNAIYLSIYLSHDWVLLRPQLVANILLNSTTAKFQTFQISGGSFKYPWKNYLDQKNQLLNGFTHCRQILSLFFFFTYMKLAASIRFVIH